jgi:hypothetical protein
MEPTFFDDDDIREPPTILRQRALPPSLPFAPFVPPSMAGSDMEDEEPPSPPRIAATRMVLVNLEDVSNGRILGGNGSNHRTHTQGGCSRGNTATSRSQRTGKGSSTTYFTATNHSATNHSGSGTGGGPPSSSTEDGGAALTRDAQRVLGGLRRQRETRENKKKDHGGAGGAFGNPSRSKKTRGIGVGSSAAHVKKNGIDEFEMLGTVLMIPAGSDHDRDEAAPAAAAGAAGRTIPSNITSPPGSPAGAVTTPVSRRLFGAAAAGRPCSLTYSSSPPTLSPPPLKRPVRRLSKSSPAPSPPALEPSRRKWTPEAALGLAENPDITSVSPPSSPSSPSNLPGRIGTTAVSRASSPRKAPFVAPPPLMMEDWSDEEEEEDEAKVRSNVRQGVSVAIDKENGEADKAGTVRCFSRRVLRDYSSLVRGDGQDEGEDEDDDDSGGAGMVLPSDNMAELPTLAAPSLPSGRASESPTGQGADAGPTLSGTAGAVRAPPAGESRTSRFGVRSRGSLLGEDDEDEEEAKEEEAPAALYPLASLLLRTSSSSGSDIRTGGFSCSNRGGGCNPPYTFPSSKSLELQFQERDITVAPGVKLPLRGTQETMAALRRLFGGDDDDGSSSSVRKRRSDFAAAQCWTCEAYLCCLRDAEYVLCPRCRVVSPLHVVPSAYDEAGGLDDGAEEESAAPRRGVALGFTDTEWLQWRQQVSLFDD